ncbi:MAG TPA: phosphoribosylamine--glycine ligase [Roseiarcus sp.]|nr:phosphoribosylamine--glycine ligase [Roseiarcus sp.]
MNILILGSGGREHALARACARSPKVHKVVIAPGNPGCAAVGRTYAVNLADHEEIIALCKREAIDLVVVGPEAPLVAGIADELEKEDIACFGPSRAAARLEGSKGFAKDFCKQFGIPTAEYRRFIDCNDAKAYIRSRGAPIVVKADGLAAGKGVIVASTVEEAEAAVDLLLPKLARLEGVVVEEFLEGEEVSFFALCDGVRATPFASAQDHKRVGEGDTGPNTGGMGAYSPPPIMTALMSDRIMREIVMPTIRGMATRGTPYRGVLFAGLMIGKEGPKLVEFNVRFGDPEAEAILERLADDLLPFLVGCANAALPSVSPRFSGEAALTVVMASRGYPEEPVRGTRISGIEKAEQIPSVSVLQAGTRQEADALIADGGRVLAVTALGRTVSEAQRRAYAAVNGIDWPGGFCRRDIGWRAVAREASERGADQPFPKSLP